MGKWGVGQKVQALAPGDPCFTMSIPIHGQNLNLSWSLIFVPQNEIENHHIMYLPGLP